MATSENFAISLMVNLFGKAIDSSDIAPLIAGMPEERIDHLCFVGFFDRGVSLVFCETRFESSETANPRDDTLILSACHLHAAGHDGYQAYAGALPGELRFGATAAEVQAALGRARASGGGDFSPVMQRRVQPWLRYVRDATQMQFQFSESGGLEMLSLQQAKEPS